MIWWQRIFRKKQLEKQLDAEVEFHFERQVADNIRAGMSQDEAGRDARLKFGGLEQVRESCRDARGTLWLESTLQDLRFALRTLRKSPGFALAAIATLALGIGANTAIFQLFDAVRLRSLPVASPQTLIQIQVKNGNGGMGVMHDAEDLTYPLWEQIRAHHQPFSGVFAWAANVFPIGEGAQQRFARGLSVSGEMFSVLGVPPVKGRLFLPRDDRPGCGVSGVVISYAMWQSEFGGRDSAIGSKLVIHDIPIQVIGVTPPYFTGLEVGNNFDFALPFCSLPALFPGDTSLSRRDFWWVTVMARLKSDWTVRRASAYLNAISPALLAETMPTGYSASTLNSYRSFRLAAYPAANGVSWLRQTYDTSLSLLLGITALVLLIACANLANLMLARSSARERELAVRLAIGASRWRLIRQLLSEGMVLAVVGALFGIWLASALSRSIVWFLSTGADPLQLDLRLDWRVLAFTAALAILTCILFGVAPALRSSRAQPGIAINSGTRGMTAGRDRFSFQRILVISQISVSFVLVVVALLFVRSFRNLMTLDPGFHEQGVLLAYVNLRSLRLPPERLLSFERELLEQIRTMPQIESAATATHVPLDGSSWTLGVQIDAERSSSKFSWVSPQYFETMRIPILAGRDFAPSDTANSPKVAIVNQTFVRQFFKQADPIGKIIRTAAEPNYPATPYEIVGVTKDTKYAGLREEIPPQAFAPASQFPAPQPWQNVLIRSSAPPANVISAVKQTLVKSHPGIGMEFHVFQTQVENGLVRERLMAALSGFFGVLAALLAAIGLYGVISYIVLRRRNEIGIRMALGAGRYQVVRSILREAMLLLSVGLAIGVIISLIATTSARALLFGLQPYDPLTLLAAAALLAAIAALATYLPAQRASRLDPMIALRYE